jgi:hypothetical protein
MHMITPEPIGPPETFTSPLLDDTVTRPTVVLARFHEKEVPPVSDDEFWLLALFTPDGETRMASGATLATGSASMTR